ncbi:sodium/solute symporter [Algibacter amylolyticus]|uniref:Sodium/solute symporter n=1 Tax=Algibacter amylolyticus TaxID=1608400 RepID=A0A5M7BHZ6_9FLAO|nr:sodium/solute symporter [Algibacter amylolyticus]KAA5827887.1 sodium/solute symporter [Algibacter amylolyticus]MBB5267118.1 SSS family transporter [Algibacter amylolyticus]TSJ82132.1 sodium/solute symporter [Algibacter amylolyticus]
MNWLDYSIVIFYIVFFLGMGFFFKDNKDSKDYFLGGKSMGWFPLSLSTMATQLSAISFISAPAFVGLKIGGGMKWLTFEFAVPLAMIFIMIVIIPPLFRSGVVSIYEFVEKRFSTSTRLILSIVFQISRALGTGVMVYTIAIILQAVLNIDFVYTILIISVITIIYSWQGGMKAVVWGDAIQMIILFAGLIICLYFGWNLLQEHGGLAAGFDAERLQVIDHNLGIGEGNEYGLLPMIIGGFFLYASYYGCDQTQAQRLLSAKDEKTIRTLLMANGLLRFPVVLIYCIMGLVIGGLITLAPDFLEDIAITTQKYFPDEYAAHGVKADLMVPVFILKYLPHGLIGILMVGILSAAMSSLSSTVNSLSAVTVEDFFNRGKLKLSSKKYMLISKGSVVFWGVVCIAAAFLFGGSKSAVIEIINAIGSVFYGPVLVTFFLAFFSKKVNHIGMNAAIISAVLINLIFSKTIQELFHIDLGFNIFWIWLNFTGVIIALVVAYTVTALTRKTEVKSISNFNVAIKKEDFMIKEVYILLAFFVFILVFSYFLPSFLS